MANWFRQHIVLVLTVIAPTSLAILYFGLFASDIYVSESQYVVHTSQTQTQAQSGSLSSFLQSTTGLSVTADPAYSVQNFITSRDAVRKLDAEFGVRKIFSSNHIDLLHRFPGLYFEDSFERFFIFYGDRIVDPEYDSVSSITTLDVRAFTAADAQRINELLLQMSEDLVNDMNNRSRQDLVRFAEYDVKVATDKATAAALALFEYRSHHTVYEPDKQAELQLETVDKVQEQLIATDAQIAQLKQISPSNPQIPGLQSLADSLRHAIITEGSKVTDTKSSFSARQSDYEKLSVAMDAADKQLELALADLESARSDARRKVVYLERLVEPGLPDKAQEPRRVRSIFTVLLLSLIAWGVASLLIAAIREHSG
jgi:capsular polysaccharide transport system permease protein